MSILGHRVLRREDPALLRGEGTFTDDIHPPGAAFATFVRSTMPHARILSIDVDEARAAPGVLAVITSAELDAAGFADLVPFGRPGHPMSRPLLARDIVRFAGEPVAVVVTEELTQGVDAAEQVWIDYEPLPAVVDAELAVDADPIFAAADSNVCRRLDHRRDPVDLSGCEVVVSFRARNQRVAACPIEPRVALAQWDDEGRLVMHLACQGAHPVRDELASVYGLEHTQVRVVSPDVGGGFGAKAGAYPEHLVLPHLARLVGRPVRWFETRTENMLAMGHGRAQIQDIELGGRRDGTIEGYRLRVIQDAGAYPSLGASLPWMTGLMVTGCYDLPVVEFSSQAVVTTTAPTVAYRGAGRPEAAAAIERAVDVFAAEIGMDPAEVRRRNLVASTAFPYTTAAGTTYDSGDYLGALERALDAAGYDELRAEQAQRRAADDPVLLGIGVSSYVEITALGAGGEYGSVELLPDGRVLCRTGSNPYGQGHHTTWAMLVSDRLGIPMERIDVVHGDTDLVAEGSVTGGSRSVQLAGSAMAVAAEHLRDAARERAAALLEAAVEDVVLSPGDGTSPTTPTGAAADSAEAFFHVTGTPAVRVSWAEVAAAPGDPLLGISDFAADESTFPFGAHVAVVEVDRETGQVRLVRHVACDDAGTIINPMIVEGQVHGGVAQGVAQALYEEMRYDADGNPLTATFAEYPVIAATELPRIERIPMETPSPLNPLGAKGIGESGTIGSMPAVQNAVVDAVRHLGVRHIDMPCTPEKVWQALRSAGAA